MNMLDMGAILSRAGEKDAMLAAGMSPNEILLRDQSSGSRALNPCGQVAGGLFGPGNTCAASDGDAGGGGGEPEDTPEGSMPTSAANCPPVCEMLTPVEDGGTLKLPANDRPFIEAVDWSAARSADDEVLEAIRAYTGDQYESANNAARDGSLDHVLVTGNNLDEADPDDILHKYGDDDLIPITDSDALDVIDNGKDALPIWENSLNEAQKIYAEVKSRWAQDHFSLHGEEWPAAFDPSFEFTSVKPTPGDPHDAKTIYIPGMRDHERQSLNDIAETIRDYRETFSVDTPEALLEKLDSLVADNSPSWISGFSRKKDYTTYDDALQWAYDAARESDEFSSGTTLESLDDGLRQIASDANTNGPIASWRSTGGGAKSLADGLSPGDIFSGEGFLSTSASPTFAVDWKGSAIKTLWRFVGSSGAPIDRVSSAGGEYEILYPHSASFRVANVAKDVTIERTNGSRYTGVTVVDLVETEDE
jgi:hypothetical protein